MVRFLHTSDWQLGITRHFLDEGAQGRFSQDRRDALSRIGEVAEERDAEFVVVAGDAFDSNQVDRQTVLRALDTLGTVPLPVFILPGNHDPLDAASVYETPVFEQHAPDHVHVLRSREPVPVGDDAEVVGVPWTSSQPLTDMVAETLDDLEPTTRTRVVVAHGAVDTLSPDADDPALVHLERVEEALSEGLLQYLALGDRHSTTEVGSTGRVWYSGAHEPTAYREEDPGNVLAVEADEGSVEVEAVPVGEWSFIQKEFHLSGDEDLDRLRVWMDDLDDKARTILKFSLKGTLNLQQKARLDDLLDRAEDLYGAVERWDRHEDLAVLPDEEDLDELELEGFAEEAFDRLQSRSEGEGEEAAVAEDALGILYRYAGEGSP